MRLFIAVFAKVNDYTKMQRVLNDCFEGKWTREENLHLTFKFLGEVQKVKEVLNAMAGFEYPKGTNINFDTIKLFEGRKKVLYLSTSASVITTLQEEIARRCDNFEIDSKEFIPHLTLMRIKKVKKTNYEAVLKNYENQTLATSQLKIMLIQSTVTKDGPIYKIIKEF